MVAPCPGERRARGPIDTRQGEQLRTRRFGGKDMEGSPELGGINSAWSRLRQSGVAHSY